MAVGPSVLGKVKEISVREVSTADTFCTIMSMLISVVGDRREDPRSLTDPIRYTDDRDLGFASIMDDSGDDRLLHGASFLRLLHPGTVLVGERGPYVHPHVLAARILNAP